MTTRHLCAPIASQLAWDTKQTSLDAAGSHPQYTLLWVLQSPFGDGHLPSMHELTSDDAADAQ